MPYDLDLVYRPGKDDNNPADYISRHPCSPDVTDPAEHYVNYICRSAVPKAMTLEEVKGNFPRCNSTGCACRHQ